MFVIRPILLSDEQSLYELAEVSGYGFTSLPMDKKRLIKKIERSVESFAKPLREPGSEFYLMVLEDTTTGQVIGSTGIAASVGLDEVFYHYRLTSESHHCRSLDIHNVVETLHLCNDYTCSAELCSLFLLEKFRGKKQGSLLSRSRFLFLANTPERFGQKVIAEMRGECDEKGYSPFYAWLQELFLKIDFPQADYLCGIGDKSFIAELMPKHPIFKAMLSQKAQDVIGRVHEKTKPALKMLEQEGFTYQSYIDIFDGGPTIECELSRIKSVKESQVLQVEIAPEEGTQDLILSNLKLAGFRAVMDKARIHRDKNTVYISEKIARHLDVVTGDKVRVVA
tara:strand:- start:653 stop:1666 length:1014 start_codon:yes stop_codon:yes gene_type:complete